TAGLKTTHGRVPLEGVWPLASSLDTIGPMARDAAGLLAGMRLLEPGFEATASVPATIGRFRHRDVHPEVDGAVDRALASVGCKVRPVDLHGWDGAFAAGGGAERAAAHHPHDAGEPGRPARPRASGPRGAVAGQHPGARTTGGRGAPAGLRHGAGEGHRRWLDGPWRGTTGRSGTIVPGSRPLLAGPSRSPRPFSWW